MKILKIIALILAFAMVSESQGQEMIHKVSREQNRSFDQDIEGIQVRGEKASVSVSGWNRDYVSVVLRPVSRNIVKSDAIAELKIIKYSAQLEGKELIIRNSFSGNKGKISSNLSMEIEIRMPSSLPIHIKNLYGPVEASGLSNINLEVSFGQITLSEISGYAFVRSRYTDIEISKATGSVSIEAEKSDINAIEINALTQITSKYGKTEIELTQEGQALSIDAYRTEVRIMVQAFEDYNYKLNSTHGAIHLPSSDEIKREGFEIHHSKRNKNIEISTTYSDITIAAKLESYAKHQD